MKQSLVITETDPMMKALYIELLADIDVDTTFVTSVDELKVILEHKLPSFLLVTYEGINGLEEYCALIREDNRYKNIPIMLVTAREGLDTRVNATRMGVDYIMYKPFSFNEMEARLQSVLKKDAIREQESLRSFLFQIGNQLPFGIVVVEEDGRILNMNRNALVYLNLSKTFFLQSFDEIINERLKSSDIIPEGTSIQEELLSRELTYVQKTYDGEPKWFRLSAMKMKWGENDRVLIYIKDCSSLIRRQNLSWSLRSMLGHKLRTPLNGVIAPLTYIKQEPPETKLDEIQDLLNMASVSATRLHEIVEQILGYVETVNSHGSHGALVLEVEPILQEMADEMDIPIHIKNEVDNPSLIIRAKEHNLDAMFHELFSNAHKFHPQHSPSIDVALYIRDNRLIIKFCDDGRHVSEDSLSKLCTPFFQDENYFTGEQSGAGLGLSQINQLLWSIGGSINIRNRLDKPGLVVDIHIPIKDETAKAVV